MNALSKNIVQKRKYLHAAVLLLFISCFISCKKKTDSISNNNEMKATVVTTSGNIIVINATGANALAGCASFGGRTFVDGTNASHQAVYINVYGTGIACINKPGSITSVANTGRM